MIDETELESAKSSHVYQVADSIGTNLEAAQIGYILEDLKQLSKDQPMEMLKYMEVKPFLKNKLITQSVTVEHCKGIVRDYLVPLFETNSSDVICISGSTTVQVSPLYFIRLTSGNCGILYYSQVQNNNQKSRRLSIVHRNQNEI